MCGHALPSGKVCRTILGGIEHDPHTLCKKCRLRTFGKACARDSTCPECERWTEPQWDKFEGHLRTSYAARKARREALKSAGFSSSSDEALVVTPVSGGGVRPPPPVTDAGSSSAPPLLRL